MYLLQPACKPTSTLPELHQHLEAASPAVLLKVSLDLSRQSGAVPARVFIMNLAPLWFYMILGKTEILD